MTQDREPLWTIGELAAQAARALSVGYDGQSNGSVRDVPDIRTIRYYTTLGLIDRPAEMRGRTALYRRRHLLQIVAIKRLQAQGLPLEAVQERMLVLTHRQLERLADVPETLPSSPEPVSTTSELPPEEIPDRREQFWRAVPEVTSEGPEPSVSDTGTPPGIIQGIDLGNGVTLLMNAARPLGSADLEALRSAAAPLLHCLERRRLLKPGQERRSS